MSYFTFQELDEESLAQKDAEFRSSIYQTPQASEAYLELKNFFSEMDLKTIRQKYYYSYWRWYVRLTWSKLNGLGEVDFLAAINKQIPMAVLLDIDVKQNILWYFAMNYEGVNDRKSIYLKTKKTFLESEAVVGNWKDEDVTIRDLVDEITGIDIRNDSLEQAEFQSKLRQVLFPNDSLVEKYYIAEPDKAVESFMELVFFFQNVSEDDIRSVVYDFLYPETAELEIEPSAAPVSVANVPLLVPTAESFAQKVVQPILSNPPLPRPSGESPKPVAPSKPTLAQIKLEIESQFKKDSEGNFVDIEGVMAKLSDLAEKNNDSKIAEMIYFDEVDGKFKWSV